MEDDAPPVEGQRDDEEESATAKNGMQDEEDEDPVRDGEDPHPAASLPEDLDHRDPWLGSRWIQAPKRAARPRRCP